MKVLTGGCTRLVILIGNYAFKIPRLNYGWKLFLTGLLSNLQEVEFSPIDHRACPVVFHIWGGWLVVMRRCTPVSDSQWEEIQRRSPCYWLPIPVEYRKRDSFGDLNGDIKIVDYGS